MLWQSKQNENFQKLFDIGFRSHFVFGFFFQKPQDKLLMMDRDFKNEAEMPKVGNPNLEIERMAKN